MEPVQLLPICNFCTRVSFFLPQVDINPQISIVHLLPVIPCIHQDQGVVRSENNNSYRDECISLFLYLRHRALKESDYTSGNAEN